MPFIYLQGHEINFWVRRSQRAKRLQAQVKHDGFEFIAPMRLSNFLIYQFLHQCQDWLVKHTKKKTQKTSFGSNQPSLMYQGQAIHLQWDDSINQFQLNQTTLNLPTCLKNKGSKPLIHWYHAQTHCLIEKMVVRICSQLSLWPNGKVSLKYAKTRWGSCGIHNNIYINWILVFAPPQILEYVVIHELCHLRHKNHGKRFWQLVEEYMPNYRQMRYWLKLNGNELHVMAQDLNLNYQLCQDRVMDKISLEPVF